jgi:hypothetical protein
MLCCGLFALLAAAALGAWRLVKARRRLFLALAGVLLAAGPVAALAMDAETSRGRTDPWVVAMRNLCSRSPQTLYLHPGDPR